jgi:DNA-damage-inducible protein J
MSTVNVTVRVDKDEKREFDVFCNNVGVNMTSAVNMFIKAVLRTRQFPFTVTDLPENKLVMAQAKDALRAMQDQSAANGLSEMTMGEIDAEIAAARRESGS